MQKKAVVLFSGGLDSTTCLAVAKAEGFDVYALSFDYGQTHVVELESAMKLAKAFGVVDHKVINLPLTAWGGSSLTDANMDIPDYTDSKTVPSTYVPARNTIFLSYALAYAEVTGAHDIFIGANIMDYSGYPDCRPAYLEAFENLANLATKAGQDGASFKVHAPLLQLEKAGIIKLGLKHGVNYGETVSCYRANAAGQACGMCDSCVYRKKGFKDAGVEDPTRYVSG